MDEREELDWQTFGDASRALAQAVVDDGFRPDVVLCVARGGLLLAGALGYALDVKHLVMMNVLYYTGVDERLAAPVVLRPTPDGEDLAGKRVLVADDVSDTGATLRVVRDFCVATPPTCAARCCMRSRRPPSVRIRVAAHRPLDQLPVVERTARGRGLILQRSGPDLDERGAATLLRTNVVDALRSSPRLSPGTPYPPLSDRWP